MLLKLEDIKWHFVNSSGDLTADEGGKEAVIVARWTLCDIRHGGINEDLFV